MSLFTILIYVFIVLLILRFIYINKKFKRNDATRADWLAIPFFGHFYGMDFSKPFYEINNNTKHMKDSGGFFMFWFMDQLMIFCTDPYVVREFFNENSESILNRPITYTSQLFSHNFSSLSQARDERWYSIRNTFSHVATNIILRKKSHYIEEKTKDFIQYLHDNKVSEEIESWKLTKPLLLNVLYEYFGRSESYETTIEDERSWKLIDSLFLFISKTQAKPLLNSHIFGLVIATYYKLTGLKLIMKPYKLLDELLIQDHIKTIDRSNPRDSIDELIILNESYPKHQQSEFNILGPVFDMFSAGINSTSAHLEWFMVLMANYPNVQTDIYNEIIDNVISVNEIGEKFIGIQDKSKTPLLNSVITEVVRFKLGTSGGPRMTKDDLVVRGKFIPAGTSIAILTNAIFNDPNYWGNPEVFVPDRFVKENKGHMDRMLHFGLNKRMCPGRNIANDVAYLFCANLILNFTWSSFNGEKINEIPDFKLNAFPTPHKLILKKRN